MANTDSFRSAQYEFAAHLRDPKNNPAPADIESRRMKIYGDLFINNVRSLLAGTFPILFEILGEERWAMLTRDYYRDHRSHSPLFPEMPKEFLQYLAEERGTGTHTDPEADLPFMHELAHYEWVEAGLMLVEESSPPSELDPNGDLVSGIPYVRPAAWLLRYTYPVHEIGPELQPTEPAEQPYFFLVYRNNEFDVKFIQLNAVSARLFELLQQGTGTTGQEALEQIAAELQHPHPEQVISSGADFLYQWRSKDIILGTI